MLSATTWDSKHNLQPHPSFSPLRALDTIVCEWHPCTEDLNTSTRCIQIHCTLHFSEQNTVEWITVSKHYEDCLYFHLLICFYQQWDQSIYDGSSRNSHAAIKPAYFSIIPHTTKLHYHAVDIFAATFWFERAWYFKPHPTKCNWTLSVQNEHTIHLTTIDIRIAAVSNQLWQLIYI